MPTDGLSATGRPTPTHPPGSRFVHAVQLVCDLHRNHTRKGTTAPYVSHLLGVASLLLEHGADEDVAIAGLLHDVIEDADHLVGEHGEPVTGEQVEALVEEHFGERVLRIVLGNTDTVDPAHRGPDDWTLRKTTYLDHLDDPGTSDDDVVLVSLADKVHNARALATDLERHGDAVWDRFNAGSSQAGWYYAELLRRFEERLGPHPLVGELRHAVGRIWGRDDA